MFSCLVGEENHNKPYDILSCYTLNELTGMLSYIVGDNDFLEFEMLMMSADES